MGKGKLGISLILFLLLTKGASAGTYSIQLATYPSLKYAQRFLNHLPPVIRKGAFIYRTDRGYYTVRFLIASKVSELKKRVGILKEFGIKSYSFVPTDLSKLKGRRAERPLKKVAKPAKEKNSGILGTLYNVYLGDGKLNKALSVALLGVKRFPNSPTWWERLKTVATWAGKPELALKALEKLVFDFHKTEYLKELFSLALSLDKPDIAQKALELMVENNQKVNYKVILSVFNAAGESDKAAEILINKYGNNPEALRTAAQIYWYRGELRKALRALELLKERFGLGPKDRLLLAYIYFANREFENSLKTLKEGWEKVKDPYYLRTLSNLAWALGDFKTAVEASLKLISMGKGDKDDYDRAVMYFYYRKPELAAKYALEGYKKFKNSDFLNTYLFLLAYFKKWKEIVNFIDDLPEETRNKLLKDPNVLSTYTYALLKIGEVKRARQVIREALKEIKNPPSELLSQLISLLTSIKDADSLKKVIKEYKSYESLIPEDFFYAYLFLQDGKDALRCAKMIKSQNLSYLLSKADALELYGKENEANKLRFEVFKRAKEEIKKKNFNPEVVEAFLRSEIYFEQPEKFEEDYLKLKKYLDQQVAKDVYLTYLFYRDREDEANYLYKRKGWKLAPWMKLSLALDEYDDYWIKRLISKYLDILPIRDRVFALEEIEEFGKAFTIAYKGLEENREDNRLYRQLRDLAVDYSDQLSTQLSLYKSGKLYYFTPKLSLRWHEEDNTYFKLEGEGFRTLNRGNIFDSQRGTYRVSLSVKRLFHRTSIAGGITIYKMGSKQKGGIFIEGSRTVFRGSQLTMKGYLNQKTDITEVALFTTLKTGLGLEYSFPITNKYSWYSSLYVNNYSTIDGTYAGRGKEFYTELSYQARSGYPDYRFRTYLTVNSYKETSHENSFADKVSLYRPADILPLSFYEVGIGLNFGYENRDSFVRIWRPYFDSTLSYNSRYGFNASLLLGIGGKLFGDDNFHIEGSVFNGFRGTNYSGWKISSGYNLWF
ncbi:tetratricopeptide repeat protein [Thermovibrio sp.]